MPKQDTHSLFDDFIDRRVTPALKVRPSGMNSEEPPLFNAAVADMDFKIPSVVTEALQARLDHGIFGYEAIPDGLYPALITWFKKRHQWLIDQDQILRAPNILNALAIAISTFSEAGDGIIVQPPVFFDFFDIINENHRTLILNPLLLNNGRYQMDFDDLEKKAALPSTKMILLCNPHNPVGRVWTKEELKTLGNICIRHNVLVISDEIHGDITFGHHQYTPFAALGNDYAKQSITCLSPAKSFNIASCCSAFTVIKNPRLRTLFQRENSRLTVNKNNAFANVAMEAAYAKGEDWLNALLKYLENNLQLARDFIQRIPEVELIEPEGTFLLWLNFKKLGLPQLQLMAFLRSKARWRVVSGETFGVEGQGFIRLNIACPNAILTQAFEQLADAFLELDSDNA